MVPDGTKRVLKIHADAGGTVWVIGQSIAGGYYVREIWPDGGGDTSWFDTLADCLDDLWERIDDD